MKFDLHLHSCLSPCASLEMSPAVIVDKAIEAGMNGIALTDHQTSLNTPAIAECARRRGLKCLYGMEVQTAEEIHSVALFDTVEQSLALTEFVYAALPKRVNDPETFGDQPIVTADDEIIDLEWRILSMSCRLTLPEIAAKTHELGGLLIAAHVDRPNFSCLGSLGAIPENCYDAVELSRTASLDDWREKIGNYALVRSSDAHNPNDVANVWTEAPNGEFSIAGLKQIFAERTTILSPRLTHF